jgi:hypothetical protein
MAEVSNDPRADAIAQAFAEANVWCHPNEVFYAVQQRFPDLTADEFQHARETTIRRLNQALWRAKAPHLTRPLANGGGDGPVVSKRGGGV